jgi:hypothetical protein
MQPTKRGILRCGITLTVVLAVAWAIWRCQQFVLGAPCLLPAGWPMPHTRHPILSNVKAIVIDGTTYPVPSLLPGALVDIGVWCLILIGTGCVAWRWTANAHQWSLRTMFGVIAVVAILLGWWKYEHDALATWLSAHGVNFTEVDDEMVTDSGVPLLALLQFSWYVYVPVLFGLACGIYWIGWISGRIIGRIITMVHHVAMPKLR